MDWDIKIRIWSLLVPLTFVAISAFMYPHNTNFWIFLLIVAMVTGYTHFFVGTIYQIRGLKRNENSIKLLIVFVLIAVASFLIGQIMIEAGYLIILSLFTLFYFMLHVLVNEHRFLKNTRYQVSYPTMLSLLLLFIPSFFMSINHPSFYYTFDLEYPIFTVFEQKEILSEAVSIFALKAISMTMAILFVIIAPYIFYKRFGFWFSFLIGIIGLIMTLAVVTNLPINFVYMVHGVLVFHFVLLSLIFYKSIRAKGVVALREYIKLHLLVLIPLSLLVILFYIPSSQSVLEDPFKIIFNFGTFLTISLSHISVSFLNEPWFKKLLT